MHRQVNWDLGQECILVSDTTADLHIWAGLAVVDDVEPRP
jgi:hypothetical protein